MFTWALHGQLASVAQARYRKRLAALLLLVGEE